MQSAKSVQLSAPAHAHYHTPQQPQSLSAALEKIGLQPSTWSGAAPSPTQDSNRLGAPDGRPRQSVSLGRASGQGVARPRVSTDHPGKHASGSATAPNSPARGREKENILGREISAPVLDVEATLNMTPVRMRNAGRPILVGAPVPLDEELGAFAGKRRRGSLHTGCAVWPFAPDGTTNVFWPEHILSCRTTSLRTSSSSPSLPSQDSTSQRTVQGSSSGGAYPSSK